MSGASPLNDATIVEDAYRHFEGRRAPAWSTVVAITVATLRHVLGLGRKARHKILPVSLFALVLIPGVIPFILAVLEDFGTPSHLDLYGNVVSVAAIVAFVAFVAPGVLVADRNDGMLALYLSTPLSRLGYIGSKFVALVTAHAMLTLLPPLLTLALLSPLGRGPDGFDGWMLTLLRILSSGLAAAVLYAAAALAVAAWTKSQTTAAVFFIGGVFVSSVVLSFALADTTNPNAIAFVNLQALHLSVTENIFGLGGPGSSIDLSAATAYLWWAGWVALGLVAFWYRYKDVDA